MIFFCFLLLQVKDVLLFIKNDHNYYMNRPENKILQFYTTQGNKIILYYLGKCISSRWREIVFIDFKGIFHFSVPLFNSFGFLTGTHHITSNWSHYTFESFQREKLTSHSRLWRGYTTIFLLCVHTCIYSNIHGSYGNFCWL